VTLFEQPLEQLRVTLPAPVFDTDQLKNEPPFGLAVNTV
jgi:hypothetical protein